MNFPLYKYPLRDFHFWIFLFNDIKANETHCIDEFPSYKLLETSIFDDFPS